MLYMGSIFFPLKVNKFKTSFSQRGNKPNRSKVSLSIQIQMYQHTVDSKVDENRCKQKYELIQVIGDLYRYIT